MIDAGLPIAQCLRILSEQSESKTLRDVTTRIAKDVAGRRDARRRPSGKYPQTFDDLFTNMLAVGESGGVLDVVLQRLSGYIEKAAALKRKVKSAMVYPITIIGVAFLVIIFMMIFVHPDLREDVRRTRRGAAAAHQDRHVDVGLRPSKFIIFIILGIAAMHLGDQALLRDRPGQQGHRHASC